MKPCNAQIIRRISMGKDDYGERRAHGGCLPGAPYIDEKIRCSVCRGEATKKIRYCLPGLESTSLAYLCDTCSYPGGIASTEERL